MKKIREYQVNRLKFALEAATRAHISATMLLANLMNVDPFKVRVKDCSDLIARASDFLHAVMDAIGEFVPCEEVCARYRNGEAFKLWELKDKTLEQVKYIARTAVEDNAKICMDRLGKFATEDVLAKHKLLLAEVAQNGKYYFDPF